jgi:hypothetical protein
VRRQQEVSTILPNLAWKMPALRYSCATVLESQLESLEKKLDDMLAAFEEQEKAGTQASTSKQASTDDPDPPAKKAESENPDISKVSNDARNKP